MRSLPSVPSSSRVRLNVSVFAASGRHGCVWRARTVRRKFLLQVPGAADGVGRSSGQITCGSARSMQLSILGSSDSRRDGICCSIFARPWLCCSARARRSSPLINNKLGKFVLAAGEALSTGGIDTPNHRWAISSALAGTPQFAYSLGKVRRQKSMHRSGEGVDRDADGQFAERSTGIYSCVVDKRTRSPSRARQLRCPELLDQFVVTSAHGLDLLHAPEWRTGNGLGRAGRIKRSPPGSPTIIRQYRYMAIKDQNDQFAGGR